MLQKFQDLHPVNSLKKSKWLTIILPLFCAAALVMSGIWVMAALSQSKEQAGNQERQSRPREVKNQTRGNVNSGVANSRPNENKIISGEKGNKSFPVAFYDVLESRGVKLEGFCSKDDPVERRILEDYGAIYVASDNVMPPPVCMFVNESGVSKYQKEAKFTTENVGGTRIDLQPAAMEALQAARKEANDQGLDITPRGGAEAARRSFSDTLRLWNSRFLPALNYWNNRGRLSNEQAAGLRKLPLHKQVEEVLELEKSGIFFSTDFSKSILYSVAAPGASQHISMLALDVAQFGNARVRRILAEHGWFQTVKSDMPHFTYLGLEEKDLPSRGLLSIKVGSQIFWIPNSNCKK
jgi:hypothetical protein